MDIHILTIADNLGAIRVSECSVCHSTLYYIPMIGWVTELGFLCRDDYNQHYYDFMENEGLHLATSKNNNKPY